MEYDRGGEGGGRKDGSIHPALHSINQQNADRRRKSREAGGGGSGGKGGGRANYAGSGRRRDRRHTFDPHASITPKILVKRVVVPADPTDMSQPSPLPPHLTSPTDSAPSPPTERTLFVPSPSSSSAPPPSSASFTHRKDHHRDHLPRPTAIPPPARAPSPSVTPSPPPPPPPLTHPTPPLKLLTSHFRLHNIEQFQSLLYDHSQFTCIAAIGMQNTGKSSILNHLILRPPRPFPQADTKEGKPQHTTSGVDIIASPERLLYLDTQPLLSTSVREALQKEDTAFSSAFTAQVAVDMFDLQMPLMLLSLVHILLITVTWPIPASFITHLRHVFTLHSQLASSLPSSSLPDVLFIINKAAENSEDSPLSTHSPFSLQSAVEGMLGDSIKKGGITVLIVPFRERGSLYESSIREMRAQVLSMRRDTATAGKGGEKEWGRRLIAVHTALVHSTILREQRRVIEKRVASLHPPPLPSPSPSAASGHHMGHGHGYAGRGGDGRRGGMGGHHAHANAVKEAGDASYQRNAPATSHHKLYTPP